MLPALALEQEGGIQSYCSRRARAKLTQPDLLEVLVSSTVMKPDQLPKSLAELEGIKGELYKEEHQEFIQRVLKTIYMFLLYDPLCKPEDKDIMREVCGKLEDFPKWK